MENYRRTEILGQGAYGKVYKGQDLRSGQIVALKRALTTSDEEGIPPTTLREISILKTVSESEYIVKLLDVVSAKTKSGKSILYIIFQYLDCDLKAFMINKQGKGNGLTTRLAKEFCFQLLLGLKHCHEQGIMHRDLKPQNLLVENGIKLKIADFGLSRNFSIPIGRYTHEVVTLWYRAPEILLGAKCYSTSIDIWAVGCILSEMILGRPIFCGESEIEQLLAIFRILGTPSNKNWPSVGLLRDWHDFPQWKPQDLDNIFINLEPEGTRLIRSLLRIDPSKRISIYTSIDSIFFDEIRNYY
nr:cyclin-dependent kinase-like 2 [Cryptomonas curvata]